MWKHWINGILGLLVIFLNYAGFQDSFKKILFVISGILIAVFSFWSVSERGPRNIAE